MENFEITQKRYQDNMGNNPSRTELTPDLPVNRVTWHEALQLCKKINRFSQIERKIANRLLLTHAN